MTLRYRLANWLTGGALEAAAAVIENFAAADFAPIYAKTRDPQDEPDPVTDYYTVAAHQEDAGTAKAMLERIW